MTTTAKSAAQRQRELRQRRAEKGLTQLTVYAPQQLHSKLRSYAARLVKQYDLGQVVIETTEPVTKRRKTHERQG